MAQHSLDTAVGIPAWPSRLLRDELVPWQYNITPPLISPSPGQTNSWTLIFTPLGWCLSTASSQPFGVCWHAADQETQAVLLAWCSSESGPPLPQLSSSAAFTSFFPEAQVQRGHPIPFGLSGSQSVQALRSLLLT